MRLRIAGGQARGLLRLAESAGQVSLANKRVRKVHVRLHKIRFQAQRFLKLANGGIDLVFRDEHPAERVVAFGALRYETNDFFKRSMCGIQVSFFESGEAL